MGVGFISEGKKPALPASVRFAPLLKKRGPQVAKGGSLAFVFQCTGCLRGKQERMLTF